MDRYTDETAWVSFEERTLERPDCVIHYWIRAEGSGPWAVLLHGTGADHRMFTAQLPALEGRRAVAIDARGHGASRQESGRYSFGLAVDDIVAALDAEGIAGAAIIGQSAGGNFAQEIALRYPGRAIGLVVIDSAYNLQRLSRIDAFLLRLGGPLAALYPWRSLVRASAVASAETADARAYIERSFLDMGRRAFIRAFSALGSCISDGGGRSIGLPILLVVGSKDGLGNILKFAPSWPVLEPDCRLELLDGAGHCSNMDRPESFNRLLSAFLERMEAVGAGRVGRG
ncbi:MAG: alpha/beta hydrolase [Spirochaetes bacterium]|nr:alpha/beta hydrolase [Spirochaetota bacterium]MBU1082046.1 alpha/beta hydrolase [Spirochaetota bacterium]